MLSCYREHLYINLSAINTYYDILMVTVLMVESEFCWLMILHHPCNVTYHQLFLLLKAVSIWYCELEGYISQIQYIVLFNRC